MINRFLLLFIGVKCGVGVENGVRLNVVFIWVCMVFMFSVGRLILLM